MISWQTFPFFLCFGTQRHEMSTNIYGCNLKEFKFKEQRSWIGDSWKMESRKIPCQWEREACLVINERRARGPAISPEEASNFQSTSHFTVTRNAEWPENIAPPSHFSLLPEPPQAWPLSLRLSGLFGDLVSTRRMQHSNGFQKKGSIEVTDCITRCFSPCFSQSFFFFFKCTIFFYFLKFNFDINTYIKILKS